jgi:hypothetical protein
MKKSKTSPGKLVLRRENIGTLTLPQLKEVGGADAEQFCSCYQPRSCNPPTRDDVEEM